MHDLGRRLRFALLQHVALPIGMPPMRALMRSWRLESGDAAMFEPFRDRQRLIIATCHGMLLHVLAYTRLSPMRDRRFVVLLSPSRDGRLLAAFLARFGVGHAVGMTGVRGVAGAHAFARRVRAGEVGVIAVDGPRGPCGEVSPGFLRIAAAADADVHLAITSADRGITFASWDRAHLPTPFARLRVQVEPLPVGGASIEQAVRATQARVLELAAAMQSPVLPGERGARHDGAAVIVHERIVSPARPAPTPAAAGAPTARRPARAVSQSRDASSSADAPRTTARDVPG